MGDWDFKLGLIKNEIWDIFVEKFMRKGQVKELPALAKENLQAECVITLYKDDMGFKKLVDVQLGWIAHYYHCYVTGNWSSYVMHYRHLWYTYIDTYAVDYSAVWA